MMFLLIDLDGVLVKDKSFTPFEDSKFFIEFLKEKNVPFKILSNNSRKPPSLISKELKEKGIILDEDLIQTPFSTLIDYLRSFNIKNVFVIGTDELKTYLFEKGFNLLEDYKVEAVIIGQDKTLDFRKLKLAISSVFLNKAKIVPLNHSKIVKDDDGLYFQGSGALAFMIKHATNYEEDIPNLGKPSKIFIDMALKGFSYDKALIISDDIYTDLIGAKELGLKTAFLTTGKYSLKELEKANFKPDFVANSLKELLESITIYL